MIRKGYTDGPFGQLHWRKSEAKGNRAQPDLYCLHPAPFSGLAFTAIMPHLAQNRRVIAPDYPGHGGSDSFKHDPSVEDYAKAIAALIPKLSDGPVDLMGFHTGCLVAVEMALSSKIWINRLALVDVPAFDADTRSQFLASAAKPPELTEELECLSPAWERGITKRVESQGMERSFAMFVEQLRHGEHMNAAFHAGFSYDVEDRLPKLKHPAVVIASQSMLLEPTRRAAEMIAGAKLVERLDITRAVLDEAAETTAAEVLKFLDEDAP